MSDNHEFDFDQQLVTTEIPVRYQGKDYTLREPSEDSAAKYRSFQLRNARMVGGKLNADITKIAESQAFLLSMCLYNGDGHAVSIGIIRSWPARIIKPLFEKAREMGSLIEGEETVEQLATQITSLQKKLEAKRAGEDRAKNLPSAMLIGSS